MVSFFKATIESGLFNLEKIELLVNNKEETLASTSRSTAEKETKVFTLAAQNHGDSASPSVALTPEMFQGILSYAILNNCLAILYHDNACYRLIKITA